MGRVVGSVGRVFLFLCSLCWVFYLFWLYLCCWFVYFLLSFLYVHIGQRFLSFVRFRMIVQLLFFRLLWWWFTLFPSCFLILFPVVLLVFWHRILVVFRLCIYVVFCNILDFLVLFVELIVFLDLVLVIVGIFSWLFFRLFGYFLQVILGFRHYLWWCFSVFLGTLCIFGLVDLGFHTLCFSTLQCSVFVSFLLDDFL